MSIQHPDLGRDLPADQSIVEVKDLVIEFDTPHGRVRVVDQVSFSVRPGEVLGILGESGSGKTMSTQAILGLIDGYPGIMGGEIALSERHERHQLLSALPEYLYTDRKTGVTEKRARAWQKQSARQMKTLWGTSVTAIFQNPRLSLDPLMTVGKQVVESIRARNRRNQALYSASKLTASDMREEAIDWFKRVQMPQPTRVFSSYPHELSGGMCQRAMIAVALACKPKLLIADEPTTGLDATVRAEVVKLLQGLLKTERCAMLYITHDIREMLYLADRVIVMRHGEVLESVPKALLRTHPQDRAEYTQLLLSAAGIGALTPSSPEKDRDEEEST